MEPVANDDIDLSFNQFAAGFLTIDELLKRLRYKKLNNQISFHSKWRIMFISEKMISSIMSDTKLALLPAAAELRDI